MDNISCCQVCFHFPRLAHLMNQYSNVLTLRQLRLRLFEVCIDFPFRLRIRYVSGEASLCKWRLADMDIQSI